MSYFNYHAIAKKLIANGKLVRYIFMENYNGISPALVLFFDNQIHPIMPIRENKFEEYTQLIEKYGLSSQKNISYEHQAKTKK